MKFSAALVALTTIVGLAAAQRGGSRQQQKADLQALKDLAGTAVDPDLENGTRLLSNGQGQCVAVSGTAVCSDSSGATLRGNN